MKHWIFTARIDPDALCGVISGRFGASVMSVSYDKFLGRWMWVYPGGAEKIAQPQMLFLERNWARQHPAKKSFVRRENPLAIRRQKAEQMMLL